MTLEETSSTPSLTKVNGLRLTAKAIQRLNALNAGSGGAPIVLRVLVDGGGCAGFQYNFSLESRPKEGDHVFTEGGATVVIDDVSLSLLQGAEIDFVENLMHSSFLIRNPNAASSCGCGNSFSL